ncbi:phage minor head protein [Streptomyces sp. NPDC005989]|uniref:phage minor head protein n=1 Tax=Streptomyces sp. NPDC005989 TaxID=3156727 RepID=UPI0033C6473F
MADNTTEDALTAAETYVAAEVRAVLDEVAADTAAGLKDATEIVAARFSLAEIGRRWTARMPRIVRRLLRVAEDAGQAAASDARTELPEGWDDLPGRYDRDEPLPASLGSYVTSTEHLLRAVGDRLTEAAVAELAAGLDAGDDIDALRARLRALFSRDGSQLGDTREERIARTESNRAWNAATLAAAEGMAGEGRPLVKQWQTRRDAKVRDAHDDADGQIRLLDEEFTVGGVAMRYPGDPAAPPGLTVNCRCILRLAPEQQAAAYGSQDSLRGRVSESKEETAAADGSHLQGGMIALLPRTDDARFLALPDGEDPEELHCTLWFLGDDDAPEWTDDQRSELVDSIRAQAAALPGPITGRTFGVNHWNPDSDSPAWVWAVGDDRDSDGPALHDARAIAMQALEDTHDRPDTPAQHSPWVAHITGAYAADTQPFEPMCERLGPVVFDRIRVAFGGDHHDIPIGPEQEEPMATPMQAAQDTSPPPVRSWSTPGMTALAFEDEQTGDGRVFAPNALYWDGHGPWPLQYAEAMGEGHQGAELAGAIHTLGRDSSRITGSGVLYLTQAAGFDAFTLLDQDAPLGVSVDLDDVDVQLVDTTASPDDEPGTVLEASFASASAMRLADGTWMITGRTSADWTASGAEMAHSARTVMLFTRPGGTITAATARRVFGDQLTAAAGDSNPDNAAVFHEEKSGDYLVRITRARLRGATLVAMPAYNRARIVLDASDQEHTAAAPVAASAGDDYDQVVTYIRSSPVPVSPRELANRLDLALEDVRAHVMRALKDGAVLRIARGLYVGASTIPEGHATAAAGDQAATASAALDNLYDEHGAELIASAWNAIQAEGPMPAAWFREPTREELPPGSGGVHIVDGRAYGWVAQAGVAHAAYGRKVTIEKLAARGLDYSHFLRTKFRLDDGTEVRAGAMTMNVGHHRDGYECETNVCQFDDTRTVGAVVTVGMSEGGMWFSGAAAPWLSQWDRTVFQACQPSYHMTQGQDGRWQLKAVLSVPVPGHSSPLTAAAVIDRANLALTAAAEVLDEAASTSEPEPATAPDDTQAPDVAGQITAALLQPAFLDQFADALKAREEQRAAAARTELQELTARLAPLRAEIAATAA